MLRLFTENRQRSIKSHCTNGFFAAFGHLFNQNIEIFPTVSECFLIFENIFQLKSVEAYSRAWEFININFHIVEPFPVRF